LPLSVGVPPQPMGPQGAPPPGMGARPQQPMQQPMPSGMPPQAPPQGY
jgi:hypothetical protein